MSKQSSLHRTIEILKMLNEGKKLCITSLSIQYEVSERTIRRDFELIRELFDDFLIKQGNCYQAYNKNLLNDVLSAQDLITLANIINLFDLVSTKSSISSKTNDLIKESTKVYDFKSKPFENLKNKKVIKELEHSIKFKKEIKFEYKVERSISKKLFRPYKILFLNDNFYLAGEDITFNRFELLRVSFIDEIKSTKKIFYVDKSIINFIKSIQTPWATYGKEEIKVKIKVNKRVRRFFNQKKYLPSQKVLKTFENGDIEVSYNVTNYREIEELLFKWMPNIKILEPLEFNRMAKKSLKKKLDSL